jgi:hypothetical protein
MGPEQARAVAVQLAALAVVNTVNASAPITPWVRFTSSLRAAAQHGLCQSDFSEKTPETRLAAVPCCAVL